MESLQAQNLITAEVSMKLEICQRKEGIIDICKISSTRFSSSHFRIHTYQCKLALIAQTFYPCLLRVFRYSCRSVSETAHWIFSWATGLRPYATPLFAQGPWLCPRPASITSYQNITQLSSFGRDFFSSLYIFVGLHWSRIVLYREHDGNKYLHTVFIDSSWRVMQQFCGRVRWACSANWLSAILNSMKHAISNQANGTECFSSRWLENLHAEPGLPNAMIDTLSRKAKKSRELQALSTTVGSGYIALLGTGKNPIYPNIRYIKSPNCFVPAFVQ